MAVIDRLEARRQRALRVRDHPVRLHDVLLPGHDSVGVKAQDKEDVVHHLLQAGAKDRRVLLLKQKRHRHGHGAVLRPETRMEEVTLLNVAHCW